MRASLDLTIKCNAKKEGGLHIRHSPSLEVQSHDPRYLVHRKGKKPLVSRERSKKGGY